LDLTWTGNHFLNDSVVGSLVSRESASLSFGRKGSWDAAPLRCSLAETFKVSEEWVAVGVGSSQVLDCLFRRRQKTIDVIPNFKMARLSTTRDNSCYVSISVRDPQSLVDHLNPLNVTADTTVVLSSPRNPFGDSFEPATIRLLLEKYKATFVLDEAYVDFGAQSAMPLVAEFPKLIVVRTFSKAWGLANLRVGYCIGQSMDREFREKFLLPYSVGELSQRVACALLADPSAVVESVEEMRVARANFLRLLSVLDGLLIWTSDTNYICVEHPRSQEIKRKLKTLLNIKVAELHSLPGFPSDWPAGLRITVPHTSVQKEITNVIAAML
jgi:histidinol-phosphate aminotransferase